MRIAPEFRYFEQATDAAFMLEFFKLHASRWPAPALSPEEVYVTRVFPRGEGGFVIQYELRFRSADAPGGSSQILCGELVPRGASLPGYARKHSERVVASADLGLAVPVFPFDPELETLPDWTSRDRAIGRLRDLLSPLGDWHGIGQASVSGLTVLAYRLGRRCTIRYDLAWSKGGGDVIHHAVIGRISRPEKASARNQGPPWAGNDTPDQAPFPGGVKPLAAREGEGVELLPLAPGRSLHDLIAFPTLEPACKAAGEVLARIHESSPGSVPVRSESRALEDLRRQVGLACTLFPECASVFERVVNAWSPGGTSRRLPDTLIHGDFYDKQVLYMPGRVTVVDYDAMALGEPAVDVGNFIAHMTLRSMQQPESTDLLRRGRKAFTAGYGGRSDEFWDRCRFWETATLIRLAALYALRPRWRHLCIPLLEQSSRCLAVT